MALPSIRRSCSFCWSPRHVTGNVDLVSSTILVNLGSFPDRHFNFLAHCNIHHIFTFSNFCQALRMILLFFAVYDSSSSKFPRQNCFPPCLEIQQVALLHQHRLDFFLCPISFFDCPFLPKTFGVDFLFYKKKIRIKSQWGFYNRFPG